MPRVNTHDAPSSQPPSGRSGESGLAAVGGVVAVGVDIVAVPRFADALARTPSLAARLFTPAECVTATGRARSARSLAARFAAKEAVAKALGVPRGMDWHDCVVAQDAAGNPSITLAATVADAARAAGIGRFELSLTHDAGIAAAIVVAVA